MEAYEVVEKVNGPYEVYGIMGKLMYLYDQENQHSVVCTWEESLLAKQDIEYIIPRGAPAELKKHNVIFFVKPSHPGWFYAGVFLTFVIMRLLEMVLYC